MWKNLKIFFFYKLCNFNNFYGTNENKINKKKSLELAKNRNNQSIYEETSQEGLLIFNEDINEYKYFYNGIIGEIIWEKIPDQLKDIIISKFDFQEGKELNWLTLKQILLQLNNSLRTPYVCSISINENKQLKLKFTKKPTKIYFIESIKINGNNLLSKEKIIHEISEGVEEINFINRILYLITNNSPAEFNPGIQSNFIETKIEKLCERYLILGTKVKVLYELNPHNYNVKVHINMEEGKKHFIDQIKLEGFTFDKKILEKAINEKGLEDNTFNYLSTLLMEEYNLKRITFNYLIEDNKINIYATKNLKDESLIIESVLFNVESIRLKYLTENCPVTTGEAFDEWAMRDFIYKTNFIFETKINYKIKTTKDSDKIIIEVNETKENIYKDIIYSSQEGFGIQYPFKFHSPLFSLNFQPKISINNNVLFNNLDKNTNNYLFWLGANFNIKHKINHKHVIDIIDGNVGFNLTTTIANLLRSFQISALKYFYVSSDMSLLLIPLNFYKFFSKYEIENEEIKNKIGNYLQDYVYKYSEAHFKKKILFENQELFIRSSGKYFLHKDNEASTYKFALHLDDTIKLSENIKILFTLKGLWNSQDIKDMRSIYKHLSAINNKRDEMLGLLWDYYDNLEEIGHNENQEFKAYLISKGIILSNLLLDGRFMLLFNIFKFKIPGFGLLDINFHCFINNNYDITNNIFRLSGGFGLLANINNIRAILSLGWRGKWIYKNNEFIYKLKESQDEDIKYGFNLEHISL